MLTDNLLLQWNHLLMMVRDAKTIEIPRCLLSYPICSIKSARLIGFCDASSRAYAAVIYLRITSELHQVQVKFLSAKTRVAPISGLTIPRLELLSALLLSKLANNVKSALQSQLDLDDPICFTDSKVSLFWIQGLDHEWKHFVENRVITIRSLVAPQHWKHCPGKDNPADIPSRGASVSDLAENPLWLHGPEWIHSSEEPEKQSSPFTVPEECKSEMKSKDAAYSLIAIQDQNTSRLSDVIDVARFSSTLRLFRVTALVLEFIHRLRHRVSKNTENTLTITSPDLTHAKLLWIKDCQCTVSYTTGQEPTTNKIDRS